MTEVVETIVVTADERGVTITEIEKSVTTAVETHGLAATSEIVESLVVATDERSVTTSETEDVQYIFAGEQGPAGPPGPASEEEMPYSEITDFVGEDVIYKGQALPGTAESASLWRIKKLVIGVDGDVKTTWAGGDAGFIHAWDSRANYTYS